MTENEKAIKSDMDYIKQCIKGKENFSITTSFFENGGDYPLGVGYNEFSFVYKNEAFAYERGGGDPKFEVTDGGIKFIAIDEFGTSYDGFDPKTNEISDCGGGENASTKVLELTTKNHIRSNKDDLHEETRSAHEMFAGFYGDGWAAG